MINNRIDSTANKSINKYASAGQEPRHRSVGGLDVVGVAPTRGRGSAQADCVA